MLEHVLDYAFAQIGVRGDRQGALGHRVVMTEAACVPAASRRVVSEVLFECYGVGAVAYGLDAAFSYYENTSKMSGVTPSPLLSLPGLVISAGHNATHVVPIYDGRVQPAHLKRLSIGGTQCAEHMLRSLQNKYPAFPDKITYGHAQVCDVKRPTRSMLSH